MDLSTYYTAAEIADMIECCEIDAAEIAGILELDFLDDGKPAPTADALTYHIELQQTQEDLEELGLDELGIQ